MYFPYVRGRQNELIALRELVDRGILSSQILPIIEPVKLSSTLCITIDKFISEGKKLGIICNPDVGTFDSDMNDLKNATLKDRYLELLNDSHIFKIHIMGKDSASQIAVWEDEKKIKKTDWIIINKKRDFLTDYSNIFNLETPQYVLIPNETSFMRKVKKNRVLVEDRFHKRDRNSDYLDNDDEFFSEDHLYYQENGFIGFSDYSVIGENYSESGFAAYAVAIHIIYFDEEGLLRVHHFVSDSNEDRYNQGKKFYQAVGKLSDWCRKNNIESTIGLQAFINHYNNQTFPGLGSAKKLSLMHHLELVGRYLDEVE